ncbi:hypothetical protein QFZ69_001913 [Arthrobacter sp. V1I7]|nr:hypothetical protein [Arthrobacter sp. V1I7]MDQ0821034.1 hypothetical protein [Arthrobacter sp. V1I7]
MALPTTAAAGLLAVVSACGAGGGSAAGTGPREPQRAFPVTAEVNQLRDNYGKQIVSIQLTNTSDAALTVLGARLDSALFADRISWQASPDGIELPPGQTKSLPAQLPAPVCAPAGRAEAAPTLALTMAPATETALEETAPEEIVTAADPYGVLARTNAELCLAQAADAIAGFRLDPGLEVSADGRTAVVRLLMTPRHAGPAADSAALTIVRIEGTTLLAEDPAVPWPRAVPVRTGGDGREIRLGIRPARCDPHAVAEDKVGTLLPLRVTVAGRDGVLKVDAGPLLRGRIYDFVTAACGRQ